MQTRPLGTRPRPSGSCSCLGLAAVPVLLMVCWHLFPGWGLSRFDSAVWQASSPNGPWGEGPGNPRGAMVWALHATPRIVGHTRGEIIALLGKPDYAWDAHGHECAPERAPTFGYELGQPPRGLLGYGKKPLAYEVYLGPDGTAEGTTVRTSPGTT